MVLVIISNNLIVNKHCNKKPLLNINTQRKPQDKC